MKTLEKTSNGCSQTQFSKILSRIPSHVWVYNIYSRQLTNRYIYIYIYSSLEERWVELCSSDKVDWKLEGKRKEVTDGRGIWSCSPSLRSHRSQTPWLCSYFTSSLYYSRRLPPVFSLPRSPSLDAFRYAFLSSFASIFLRFCFVFFNFCFVWIVGEHRLFSLSVLACYCVGSLSAC